MKSIFSQLFDGYELTGGFNMPPDADDKYEHLGDMEDEFEQQLSEEMRAKYLEIVTARGGSYREYDRYVFSQGVRLGMQLMLEAFLERERRNSSEK